MFLIGEPASVAQVYFENTLAWPGAPKLSTKPVEELELRDLQNLIAFTYGAYQEALQEGAQPEVMEILLEKYDEAFKALAEASQEFVELVWQGRVSFAPGIKYRKKYLELAGKP